MGRHSLLAPSAYRITICAKANKARERVHGPAPGTRPMRRRLWETGADPVPDEMPSQKHSIAAATIATRQMRACGTPTESQQGIALRRSPA
jgi:hypothetical protein